MLLGRATSLYHIEEKIMDEICHTYRAGKPIARDPRKFEYVQWREFSGDVKRVQAQPYIDSHEAPRRSPRKGELEQ